MLRQYSQAIGHLLPSLSANRKTSVRIALITCVIFICLESLRGRYKTAQVHLQNGLKLLTKRQFHSNKVDENARLCRDLIDDWILESFFQMQMQAELLNYGHRHLFCLLQTSELELPGPTFLSPSQARHHLDQLLQQILHLTEQSRQVHNTHEVSFLELLSRQRRIQAQLVSWLETYQATAARLRTQKPSRDAFAYRLLHIYHTMEDIMAHTCLSSTVSESVFDSHTDQFVSIIVQSIHAWRFTASSHMRLAHSKDMGRWIADRGWIPPLYYTASKYLTSEIERVEHASLGSTRCQQTTSSSYEGLAPRLRSYLTRRWKTDSLSQMPKPPRQAPSHQDARSHHPPRRNLGRANRSMRCAKTDGD